jgi:hypothetical protein
VSVIAARATVLVCLFSLACATAPTPRDYPTRLESFRTASADFLRRQRITAQFQGHTISFEAILQKQGETLTLLGMTPFGTKAFALTQKGSDVTFTPFLTRELPFPPRYILNDIHRTFFIGLPEAPLADGTHFGVRAGEEIREEWEHGRLRTRRFRRIEGEPAGEITVRYSGEPTASGVAEHVQFTNGWFGYELLIETTSDQAL